MSDSILYAIGRQITEEAVGSTKMKVGKIVNHPKYGRVKILDGQFWGTFGLSNFWYWKKVDKKNKPYGRTFHGYGWC